MGIPIRANRTREATFTTNSPEAITAPSHGIRVASRSTAKRAEFAALAGWVQFSR